MTEASTRSGGARIAVVVLGTAAVLGGAYALTPPERPDDGKLQRVTPQLPPLFAVESAAAAVSRAFDAAAFAEPEPDYHSGAIDACRELRTAGIVSGCMSDTATRYSVGEIVRFLTDAGAADGLIVRINGAEGIDALAAGRFPEVKASRPCALVASPGSRLIAVLGTSMSCDVQQRVRTALDRQSHVTMLACLDIVDAGLMGRGSFAAECEWWRSNSLGGVTGEVTPFINGAGDDLAGGILRPEGDGGFADSLKTVRDNNRLRPCAVVGSRSSGLIAVLPKDVSCEEAPDVQAALDHFAARDL